MRGLVLLLIALQSVFLPLVGADEARTFSALWSSLRNHTAGSPKAPGRNWGTDSLVEVHARLLQRFAELYQQRMNQTASSTDGSALAATLPDSMAGTQTRSFFSGSSQEEAFALPFNMTAFNLTALVSGDTSSLLQRLKDDLSKLDYNQLVKIAMLQGWALASMYSVYSMTSPKHSSMHAALARREAPLDHLVQITDPDLTSFQPAVCLGLQNFGGAEGYRAAYLGPVPCGRLGSAASQQVAWGSTAAFLLECQPLDVFGTSSQPTPVNNSSTAGQGSTAGVAASSSTNEISARRRSLLTLAQLLAQGRGAERQGAFTKLSSLIKSLGGEDGASVSGRLACQVAVTSSTGRGAMLQYGSPQGAAVLPYQGELNAMQIRVCNTAPSSLQGDPAAFDPSSAGAISSVTVRDLRVAGKPALQNPLTATYAAGTGGCITQLFRLGGRGAKGVVVSGWVDLNDGGNFMGFGVGDMASVVLSLGQYSPPVQ